MFIALCSNTHRRNVLQWDNVYKENCTMNEIMYTVNHLVLLKRNFNTRPFAKKCNWQTNDLIWLKLANMTEFGFLYVKQQHNFFWVDYYFFRSLKKLFWVSRSSQKCTKLSGSLVRRKIHTGKLWAVVSAFTDGALAFRVNLIRSILQNVQLELHQCCTM